MSLPHNQRNSRHSTCLMTKLSRFFGFCVLCKWFLWALLSTPMSIYRPMSMFISGSMPMSFFGPKSMSIFGSMSMSFSGLLSLFMSFYC